MEEARGLGIAKIAIIIEDDACPACQALILAYDLRDLPALPLIGCTRSGGCMCSYIPLPPR